MKQFDEKKAWVDGVCFFGGDGRESLALMAARLARGKSTVVYTPNPIMLENATRDPALRAALSRADLNLPDGIGVVWTARLLGEQMCGRVTGVDTAKGVLALAAKKGYRVFFLGGRPGVANEAARRLATRLSGLTVCGVRDGYFSVREEGTVLKEIRRASPDILFVCLGSPRQELWIDRYRDTLADVKLFMGLGGTLDVFAGNVKRAPLPIQNLGLEWLWRMALEPRRLRELPKMAAFLYRILVNSCHSAQTPQTKKSNLKKI
ncbi:MAG: WecB/TagA/CpsF family glycosyltransferase [Ruminococcaceae bacterium]|nr:WecB/TagA/CpsF family glycosyltransferase [Oscillospiraceae bacterium]